MLKGKQEDEPTQKKDGGGLAQEDGRTIGMIGMVEGFGKRKN
jgi:hypothetical protein